MANSATLNINGWRQRS